MFPTIYDFDTKYNKIDIKYNFGAIFIQYNS